MAEPAVIAVAHNWEELFSEATAKLEPILPAYLEPRRWFGGKARQMRGVTIRDALRMPLAGSVCYFTLVQVDFAEGPAESYFVPLGFAPSSKEQSAVVAHLKGPEQGVLYDVLADAAFCSQLLEVVGRGERFPGTRGEIRTTPLNGFAERRGTGRLDVSVSAAEQSNTSVIYGNRLIMKVYRRLQEGTNPDLEIGSFLTERVHFPHTAPVSGSIEYRSNAAPEPTTLAIVQGFVPNRGDAWKYTLETLHEFAGRVKSAGAPSGAELPTHHLLEVAQRKVPASVSERIGSYLDSARLLGQRTAELHLALSGSDEPEAFRPEPFTLPEQQQLVGTLVKVVERTVGRFHQQVQDLPDDVRAVSNRLGGQLKGLRSRFRPMEQQTVGGLRCRCHGDYHLGQVLYTGQDFVIIDFEGEPARSLDERRRKQSPLRDVAGMLRSFDYAAHSVDLPQDWGRFWYTWVGAAFLKAYLQVAARGRFLPAAEDEMRQLFDYYLLEKAIYELEYEMNHRPDWVWIPLQGIMGLVSGEW